jgi:predicted CXXCH cytochrome family protein
MTAGDGRRLTWRAGSVAGGVTVCVLASVIGSLPVFGQDRPRGRSETCTTAECHTGIVNRKVMHRPAARGQCLDCHEYAVESDHLFRLTSPRSDLCEECHELPLGPTIHRPVDQGQCTACHDPHGSDHRMILVNDPAQGLCTECHDEGEEDMEFIHGPVAVGACIVCHESHSSSHAKLLTKSPKSLCIECHQDNEPTGLDARHQHKPFEQGCTTCHDPHASDFRYQLNSDTPELCFTCHDGVRNLVGKAAVVHGPVAEGESCTGCHNPHFTRLPYLQKWTQPELCLKCHDRMIQTTYGRTLQDMALLLTENTNHHGPIREGACTACHQPHAGEHFSLLFMEYPPEFYAPFEPKRYALCFSCHLADLVEDESGTGLTGFRDGDLNLHWLHVNQKKGRTCRACHEVPASKRPFHIREAVPYGTSGWMLELNFEQTKDGGACTPACHKTRDYRRGSQRPAGDGAVINEGAPP